MPFRVFASGVFDNLHPGHLNFFKQASKIANQGQLIVVIARDENVLKIKGQLPKESQLIRQRKVEQYLKKIAVNHLVILGNKKKKYSLLKKINPEIILLGYDQEIDRTRLDKKYLIRRAKPYLPDKYKSSFCKY